jgi:hypothetical protein
VILGLPLTRDPLPYAMLIPRQADQADPFPPEYYSEYSGTQLQNIAITFLVVNTFFTILRFYARSLTKIAMGWDDYLYIAAYIFNIGLCINSICKYTLPYILIRASYSLILTFILL